MSDVKLNAVYRAIVTNVDDPQGRLRIKMKVPQELGDTETGWAWPALPIGLKQVPLAQTPVWAMFEGGDPQYPIYIGSWLPAGQLLGAEVGDFTIGVLKYADKRHHFDPPTLLSNSPVPGSISWGSFVMVYNSKAYTIAAGNTSLAFVYWHFGDTVLTSSATLPTLTVDDCLIFLNKLGIAANAQSSGAVDGSLIVSGSIFADSIAAGTIGTNQLAANSITAGNIAAGAINGQTMSAVTIMASIITGTTINGTTINGGVINGPTIIGGIFETAATGPRLTVQQIGGLGLISGFSADASETAQSQMWTEVIGTGGDRQHILTIQSGVLGSPSTHKTAFIQLQSEPLAAVINAGAVIISGPQLCEIWANTQGTSNQPFVILSATPGNVRIDLRADNYSTGSGRVGLSPTAFNISKGDGIFDPIVSVASSQSNVNNLFLEVPSGAVSVVNTPTGGYQPINASAFTVSSSQKVKREIVSITGALDQINRLRPVEYRNRVGYRPTMPTHFSRWHNDGVHRSLVAEEVFGVIPTAVMPHHETGDPEAISMMELVATVIGAVQELSAKFDEIGTL